MIFINERKILMPFHDSIHEVRIALTVERFDEAVQFYRDRLGLPVVKQWQTVEGSGVILTLGRHTTLELFDASQAAFVDQMEVGKRVSGPVRLALSVQDVEAGTEMFQQAGALVLSQPKTMPWGDCNARVEPPDGMQITLYQTTPVRDE
jgi:catechol 2,3-dioxygenase-like lactoylglutathione lyase family enzyme